MVAREGQSSEAVKREGLATEPQVSLSKQDRTTSHDTYQNSREYKQRSQKQQCNQRKSHVDERFRGPPTGERRLASAGRSRETFALPGTNPACTCSRSSPGGCLGIAATLSVGGGDGAEGFELDVSASELSAGAEGVVIVVPSSKAALRGIGAPNEGHEGNDRDRGQSRSSDSTGSV